MEEFRNKRVLVAGLGERGRAVVRLLLAEGAMVTVVDAADTEELREEAEKLAALGVKVHLGKSGVPPGLFEIAVISPSVSLKTELVQQIRDSGAIITGELELGFKLSRCLNIAIAGTNGKATTGALIERVLTYNDRKTILCGQGSKPVCDAVADSRNLDFLIVLANALQLQTTEFFRPAVAVILNLAPTYHRRFADRESYARTVARIFANQQSFDWAVIQSEALAELRSLQIQVPSKLITFSAVDREADIFLDRGLITSRLADWEWPLLDMDQCQLSGAHNAENLMAALAVGHILRIPLEAMVDVLKSQPPAAHCFEPIGEHNGVQFINDSKATNVDALQKALHSLPVGTGGKPNAWLIAGGVDDGQDFHGLGPLISQKIKGAFLCGSAQEGIRAAWSLFTPCTASNSLLEAVQSAVESAVSGDVVLFSPACSSSDQFRNYQHRGDVYREAVKNAAAKSAATGNEKERTHGSTVSRQRAD